MSRRPRGFRFGVQCRTVHDGPGWLDLARTVEQGGWDTLVLPDHFTEQLGPIAALSAAAAVTHRLRLGTVVLDNDFRHPVVLAKELATIDQISGGRLEVGIGAGWMRSDYDASGITYESPGARIDRLIETLDILDRLFASAPVTHEGTHYSLREQLGRPEPVQRPRPPLLLGGGGPRMLTLAACRGDIVGINPSLHEGRPGPEAIAQFASEHVDQKVALVRSAAGDRFDHLELNMLVQGVEVVEDRDATARGYAELFGVESQLVLDSPYLWIGTIDQIIDDLVRWRERWGISYWIVSDQHAKALAPVVTALAGQ